MTDTAQALAPAETVVASDPFSDAASAFKVALGQEEPEDRPRDDKGRFVSQDAPEDEEEIEASDEAEEAVDDAESDDDDADESEAADEAQRKDPTMPESWPADKAELWNAIDPSAQDFIRQRDADLKSAVNAKFMEAANVRKAHEAEILAARTDRERALQVTELAMSMIRPQEPPLSMLDYTSGDYDPDGYHLAKARYDQAIATFNGLAAQQRQMAAQAQAQAESEANARIQAIEAATRDAFVQDVPDVIDPAKSPAIIQGLIDYAVAQGAPAELFQNPTTSLEWRMIWKAKEYDRLQQAKAKVATDPKPQARKPQPAVKPGVATSRGAVQHAQRQKARERLARTGSVEDGAAVWKQFLK